MTIFQNPINIRRGLGIVHGDGLARAKITVKEVGNIHRAGIGTLAAGRTFCLVDKPGMPFDGCLKIAGATLQVHQLREC